MHLIETWQVARADTGQNVRHPVGGKESRCSAQEAENAVFRKQLANDPAARGSQRSAHGNLTFAVGGARKNQVGKIRTRHQQDERDGPKQDVERRAGWAEELLADGSENDTDIVIL